MACSWHGSKDTPSMLDRFSCPIGMCVHVEFQQLAALNGPVSTLLDPSSLSTPAR